MKMNIFDVQDMNRFMDTVDRCEGSVTLSFDGENSIDLKKDKEACKILRYMRPAGETMHLTLANEEDCKLMMNYLMTA